MSAITKTAKTMAKVHNTFFIIHLILTAKLAHFFEISHIIGKKCLFQKTQRADHSATDCTL